MTCRIAIATLGIAGACAGRASPVPAPVPSARPAAPGAPVRVVVPEQAVALRMLEAEPFYGLAAATAADAPWPSPTAALATGARARALASLARPVFAARDADAPRARLLAAMAAHPEQLTADGSYLGAVLTAIDDEARGAAALDRDPQARADYAHTVAAAALFLARFPDDPRRGEAHYMHAWASLETSASTDLSRAAAHEMLEVAAAAPDRDLAIDADLRAADYFFLDEGDRDSLVLAAQAYGALADSPLPRADKFRAEVLDRLGVVLVRLGDLAKSRARLCALHAMATHEAQAEIRLAVTFDDAGDIGTLRAACAANACPCFEPVLENLANWREGDDDPPRAREVIDLLRARFPDSRYVTEVRCVRAELDDEQTARCPRLRRALPGSDVDRAIGELGAAVGVRTCATRAWRTERHMPDGRARFEVGIGARGATTGARATSSTLSAPLTACIVEALARHRWRGLDGHVVELPLYFTGP